MDSPFPTNRTHKTKATKLQNKLSPSSFTSFIIKPSSSFSFFGSSAAEWAYPSNIFLVPKVDIR
jgi:hypothetical protein